MFSVKSAAVPVDGLLNSYTSQPGCHTDCFTVSVANKVPLADFIMAFFNSPVFRLERLLLGLFASKPSVKKDVENLASGTGDRLAAWSVEARNDNQLLLAVGGGPIRTWLMVEQFSDKLGQSRLYFGSAVLASEQGPDGKPRLGRIFRLMLGFHEVYSRLLLWLAARNLQQP